MATPISKWLQIRYSILWRRYRNKKINFQEIATALQEKDNKNVSVILSDLNKNGWVLVDKNKKDKRKAVYQLRNPEEIITELKES